MWRFVSGEKMDSSKKLTPAKKASPPRPPSAKKGGESQVGGHHPLEQCFPRGSSRRIYHSSPFDYVEYSVKDESPPRPSSADLEARSGEKRELEVVGGRMGVSPNSSSSTTESSDNSGRGALQPSSDGSVSSLSSATSARAMATAKTSPSTGNEAANLDKAGELATSSKGQTSKAKEEEHSKFEGDAELNASVGRGVRYNQSGGPRRGIGRGRLLRRRSFGMGILSRGGTRSLGEPRGSVEEMEWAGGYGSDGIRARGPTLPRGAVRGLYHFPSEDDERYSMGEEDRRDQPPQRPPPAQLGNKKKSQEMRRGEGEEDDLADEDVDTILQSYFEKYQFKI